MKKFFIILTFLLSTFVCRSQTGKDNMEDSVAKYFSEAKVLLASKEAGFWNHSLDGPIFFVDRQTRKVYANQPDKEGLLIMSGSIYTGTLPINVNIANTAIKWAGINWTMVQLPVSKTPVRRMRLLFHEMFHRIQDEINLPANNTTCDHLDTKNGRIYFRLELEALKAALTKPVHKRRKDLEAALAFRLYRYQLFNTAQQKEQLLELNEGLAEFTGVYVSKIYLADKNYLPDILSKAAENYQSFARSEAYITGPAYGILLSQKNKEWQKKVSAKDNFGSLLINTYHLNKPKDLKSESDRLLNFYNGLSIQTEENNRENERLAKEKRYKELFVEGRVLELPHTPANRFSFDPNSIFPFGENTAIYQTLTMTDAWGRLVVRDVAMIKNFMNTYVPLDSNTNLNDAVIKGPGWELELNKVWKLVSGTRNNDYKLSLK